MRTSDQLQIDFNQATIDLAKLNHVANPSTELLEELSRRYDVVFEKKLIDVPDHSEVTVATLTSKIIHTLELLNFSLRAERNKQTIMRRRRHQSRQRGSLWQLQR